MLNILDLCFVYEVKKNKIKNLKKKPDKISESMKSKLDNVKHRALQYAFVTSVNF